MELTRDSLSTKGVYTGGVPCLAASHACPRGPPNTTERASDSWLHNYMFLEPVSATGSESAMLGFQSAGGGIYSLSMSPLNLGDAPGLMGYHHKRALREVAGTQSGSGRNLEAEDHEAEESAERIEKPFVKGGGGKEKVTVEKRIIESSGKQKRSKDNRTSKKSRKAEDSERRGSGWSWSWKSLKDASWAVIEQHKAEEGWRASMAVGTTSCTPGWVPVLVGAGAAGERDVVRRQVGEETWYARCVQPVQVPLNQPIQVCLLSDRSINLQRTHKCSISGPVAASIFCIQKTEYRAVHEMIQ
jgi:hypothetical protein